MTSHPLHPIVLHAGDVMPSEPIGPLTRTDLVRYAGAGGDFNPIHHDEPLAVQAGYPTVFAMGLLHAGALGLRLARWVGPQNITRFEVKFTAQVWPGDLLELTGEVTSTEVVDGVPLADIILSVTRQTGEIVVKGTARARTAEA